MAPLSQYLILRDAEIALARSAAPQSISGNAEILILAKDGFQTAVKGSNGFVCMVDPKFWGDGLPASPILGFERPEERSTVFLIPLSRWSDGTPSVPEDN